MMIKTQFQAPNGMTSTLQPVYREKGSGDAYVMSGCGSDCITGPITCPSEIHGKDLCHACDYQLWHYVGQVYGKNFITNNLKTEATQ
ncbi:MAG: hypothetical protein ACYST3_07230 [Planctomycetota bacterium]|jgi:hypothetical protein